MSPYPPAHAQNRHIGPSSAGGANQPITIGSVVQVPKKPSGNFEDSLVRKLMLDSWNQSIFMNIKRRLQDSAMKLVHAERNGDAFDSQLVIGVRESYVNLCSNNEDKLKIYRDNFEASYLQVSACSGVDCCRWTENCGSRMSFY